MFDCQSLSTGEQQCKLGVNTSALLADRRQSTSSGKALLPRGEKHCLITNEKSMGGKLSSVNYGYELLSTCLFIEKCVKKSIHRSELLDSVIVFRMCHN